MHIYFFDRKEIFSKLTFPKDCNTKIIIYLYLNNINNVLYIKKYFKFSIFYFFIFLLQYINFLIISILFKIHNKYCILSILAAGQLISVTIIVRWCNFC